MANRGAIDRNIVFSIHHTGIMFYTVNVKQYDYYLFRADIWMSQKDQAKSRQRSTDGVFSFLLAFNMLVDTQKFCSYRFTLAALYENYSYAWKYAPAMEHTFSVAAAIVNI